MVAVLVAEEGEERWKNVGGMDPPHTTQSPLLSTATHPTHWSVVDCKRKRVIKEHRDTYRPKALMIEDLSLTDFSQWG